MTSQILAIFLALVLLGAVIWLLRKYALPEKYAVIWLVAGVIALVLAINPELLVVISNQLGVANPLNLLFLVSLIFILLVLMQVSLELAKTRNELRKVVQETALQTNQKDED